MRAAIFHGPNRITVEDVDEPRPGPDEILLKICRCGICGSDISLTQDVPHPLPLGRFGHEYAGEVVAVGRDVGSHAVGDHVAVVPINGCGRADCAGCATGNPAFCPNNRFLSGGFGEYFAVPPSGAIRLPRSIGWGAAALIEPMSCGLHALNLARMQPGEDVLVIGAGSVALSVIYWARVLGAGKVIALSRSSHRAEVVMEMGADAVLGFDPDDRARLPELFGGRPPIAAECVGKPGMLNLAIDAVGPRGRVLSLGMCQHAEPVVPAGCVAKEVQLLFPHAYTVDEFTRTARAFDAGRVRPEVMVGDVIPLEALPDRMAALHRGERHLKVHVDPRIPADTRAA